MNIAPFIPLAGCICNVFFALFVFSRNPRAPANQIYLLLGFSIATWNLGSYFLFVVPDHESALFWARFLQFGVIFGVVAFFHLALIVGGIKVGGWIRWLYGLEVVMALTNFTPLFIADVRWLGDSGWYAVAGPVFHAFNVPFSLMFGSIFVLWGQRRKLPRGNRRGLTIVIFAQALLTILGTNDILPIIGMDHYPGTNIQVYPWGSLAAVFYGILIAYSVLQHQLLDVQVGLSRIVAHVIRFAFLFSIAAGLLLAFAASTEAYNNTSFIGSLVVFLVAAVIASLLFPRVFGGTGLEKWERRILGDRFEYQDRVRAFIERMPLQSDLPTLFEELHGMLAHTFQLRSYHIILRDETSRVFSLFRSHPEQPPRDLPELRIPSPLFQYFEWGKAEFLSLNGTQRRAATVLERSAREQLAGFDAEFCLALSAQEDAFGLLLVGPKLSGGPYTATDLTLLIALVKNLGLIINQLRLKTQVLQAQELDLLGRMSRGMAHDLNNLLTPISTFLQLAEEGVPPQGLSELLPVALHNVAGIRAYVKESLFFSEHLRPDFQLGRLDLVIAQAVEVAAGSRDKKVALATEGPGEVLAEMDEVLVQRLLANLIANAIDASPEGAQVGVRVVHLMKTEATRDWLRIEISDRGEGIRKEDLNRIFMPYYTTKDRGDGTRGFGLGLAICRKIVNLHGGNLSIASQLKKGTTVQVDLPIRQTRQAPPVAA